MTTATSEFAARPAVPPAETGAAPTVSQGRAQPAPANDESAAVAPGRGSAASGGKLDVVVSAAGAGPHAVRFTLQACNHTGGTVRTTWPTGQRYDFEVSRNGKLVWRWSDGRAFTQIYGTQDWQPNECHSWSETWNGTDSSGKPVSTGSYDVMGVLTTSPKQSTAPKAFCLDLC